MKMKKALFLDRDGVVNVEKNYLYKISDFEFIDGIFKICKYYQKKGYKIFIVTNQSGIARGYYTEDDFMRLTSWMIKEFEKYDIEIQKVYFCPHHPSISGECSCRKPDSAMFIQASDEFDIDLKNSIVVGDKESDIEAGIKAGLNTSYLFSEDIKASKATQIITKLEEIIDANPK